MVRAHKTKAKTKRKGHPTIVMYVRVATSDHKTLVRLADGRGWPHTVASVTGEMISRGLELAVAEAAGERARRQVDVLADRTKENA